MSTEDTNDSVLLTFAVLFKTGVFKERFDSLELYVMSFSEYDTTAEVPVSMTYEEYEDQRFLMGFFPEFVSVPEKRERDDP